MITVTLPGLVLHNIHTHDTAYLADLTGWFDTAASRLSLEERPTSDGYFGHNPVFRGGRHMTVKGQLLSVTTGVLETRRALAQLDGDQEFEISVEVATATEAETLRATVQVNGLIQYPVEDERGIVQFSIPLVAMDPNRYHPPVQGLSTGLPVPGGGVLSPVTSPFTQLGGGNPGRITLTNPGSADSWPAFTVSGGLTGGFEIISIESGQRVRVERPIPDGSNVTVDMDDGSVIIDGQSPIDSYVTIGEWFTVPRGQTRTVQFIGLGTATGNPTMTASFAPAER